MADRKSKKTRKIDDQNREIGQVAIDHQAPTKSWINWKRVDWLVRTGFVLMLGYMFVSIAGGLLLPEKNKPIGRSASNSKGGLVQDVEPVDSLFLMNDFSDGKWMFGDSGWRFNSTDVSETPSESEFAKLPERLRQADEEFDDEVFVSIFESFRATKKKVGELTYWRASYFNAQGSMYTSSSPAGEIVQVLRLAFPVDSGKMSFVEATPSVDATNDTVSSQQLLPLCPDSEQMATRVDDEGVVSSAFVNLSGSPGVILSYWTDQGWNVTPIIRPDVPSGEQYRCEKNSVVVMANFMKTDGHCTIMLVRVPDVRQ